ncbi:MAG: helix-turn-helix domain-containing protein [Gloeobacterales cyanobacterium]
MSSVLRLVILETEKELKDLLNHEKSARIKEKLQALYLYKTGKLTSRRDLAQAVGRDEATLSRWFYTYRSEGLEKLLEDKGGRGRKPDISKEALERLEHRLADPEGFNSYDEVRVWLKENCNIDTAYHVVYKTVRYRLKSKLKVPRPQSSKVDLKEQEGFKKNCQ